MAAKHLLIVDDDPRNIFALKALLKSRAYSCASCQSAAEALALLQTGPQADAILLDMMMPDMDGYEAIPVLRGLPGYADTPIFAVTAQAMVGDRERCLQAGATDYIAKPIDVDRLFQLLSTI
ncbi:hypothetical protein GCM10027578_16690 [Spirosoma luteolum]